MGSKKYRWSLQLYTENHNKSRKFGKTKQRTCRILLLVMGPSPDPAAAQSGPIHFLGLRLKILRRAQAQPRLGLKVLRRAQKFEFLLSKK